MTARRRTAALLASAAALLLGACGVSAQSEPTAIAPEAVPFGLLEPTPSTTAVPEGRTVDVFLVSGDRLVQVSRSVPVDSGPTALVEALVAGPTDDERSFGTTTAVAPGTVARVTTNRGVADVELTPAFREIRGEDQILALAQIVFTLTEQPGIGGVRFTLDGEPVRLPTTDGARGDGRLARDDLTALAPR